MGLDVDMMQLCKVSRHSLSWFAGKLCRRQWIWGKFNIQLDPKFKAFPEEFPTNQMESSCFPYISNYLFFLWWSPSHFLPPSLVRQPIDLPGVSFCISYWGMRLCQCPIHPWGCYEGWAHLLPLPISLPFVGEDSPFPKDGATYSAWMRGPVFIGPVLLRSYPWINPLKFVGCTLWICISNVSLRVIVTYVHSLICKPRPIYRCFTYSKSWFPIVMLHELGVYKLHQHASTKVWKFRGLRFRLVGPGGFGQGGAMSFWMALSMSLLVYHYLGWDICLYVHHYLGLF